MVPTLNLAFSDFWPGFDREDNYFTNLLCQKFEIRFFGNPDVLIYSCFGSEHFKYSCRKIFYTGENVRPNFRDCDFAFSFDITSDHRNYRLPLYVLYGPPLVNRLIHQPKRNPEELLAKKSRFCNFVYSNSTCELRNKFFRRLSEYRRVDSGGKWLNNVGGPVEDKEAFQVQYKFSIAFENSSYPGYVTEKLPQAMVAETMPIYWGTPYVGTDFNVDSFLNYHEFENEDALINEIIRLDQDDEAYLDRFCQPWLNNNQHNPEFSDKAILDQFDQIVRDSNTPVAQSWTNRCKRINQRLLLKA